MPNIDTNERHVQKEVQVLDAMGKGGDGSFSSGIIRSREERGAIDAEVARIEDKFRTKR